MNYLRAILKIDFYFFKKIDILEVNHTSFMSQSSSAIVKYHRVIYKESEI